VGPQDGRRQAELVDAVVAHVDGVHLLARRVVGRDVHGVEVQVGGLHLGALGELVAHADEHVDHGLFDLGEQVRTARWNHGRRHRQVQPFGTQAGVQLASLQHHHARVERCLEVLLEGVELLAQFTPTVRVQAAHLLLDSGERRLATGEPDPDVLQVGHVGGVSDGGERLVAQRFQLGHGTFHGSGVVEVLGPGSLTVSPAEEAPRGRPHQPPRRIRTTPRRRGPGSGPA